MKNKYLIIAAFALVATLVATGTAFAYGGPSMMIGKNVDPTVVAKNFDEQITRQADILGISTDEMKADWAAGKSLMTIAKEKGITQATIQAKIQALRIDEIKQWLQTLVSQGKITQAQADSRLQAMQNQTKAGIKGFGFRHGKVGFAKKTASPTSTSSSASGN